MRIVLTVFILFITLSAAAQKNMFLRVYDLKGNKIHQGKMVGVTETSLLLKIRKAEITIPVTSIGKIKTKRSAGNNILYGAIGGGLTVGILAASTADPDALFMDYSAGQGFFGGLILGAAPGAALGGITAIFKNPVTYGIDGDPEKWKRFHSMVNDLK